MSELLSALTSQGNSHTEAIEIIADMQVRVHYGENPEEVLYEYGLEPDYIFEII
jgi:hypothetical protein